MAECTEPSWGFLTNHAQVPVCIAQDSGLRLRDIAERVHITERTVHRIVTELDAAGCITRERGRAAGTTTRSTRNSRSPTRSRASTTSGRCSRSGPSSAQVSHKRAGAARSALTCNLDDVLAQALGPSRAQRGRR